MTEANPAILSSGASCHDGGAAAGLAEWLGFAATPTLAVMALLTGALGGGPMDALCSAGHGSPLSGMIPMYLLMSAFHSPPWLKLISGRRRAATGPDWTLAARPRPDSPNVRHASDRVIPAWSLNGTVAKFCPATRARRSGADERLNRL